MGINVNIGGTMKETSAAYVNIDGVWKTLSKSYVNINGVWKESTSDGTNIGTLDIGTKVKINVNGAAKNFIVVGQGLPSSAYDISCDGTWLLMEDIYEKRNWGSTNLYADSSIHSYLNNTFINYLDQDIRDAVLTVKVPYTYQTNRAQGKVYSGASGLSTKIFLLSNTEVFGTTTTVGRNTEGAKLPYFTSQSMRIAYYNGTAAEWWTRSPHYNTTDQALYFKTTGAGSNFGVGNNYGIRPCMVLPGSLKVDDDGFVIAE